MTEDVSTEEDQADAKGRRARGEFVRGVSGFAMQLAMQTSRLNRGVITFSWRSTARGATV